MKLRKDDPIYYRNKINGLIKEAFDNDLKVQAKTYNDKIILLFRAENGDTTEVAFNYKD